MNKQYTCDVIFDLLPLYIDGMTSGETAKVVEEHLKECEVCRQMYEEMTGEIDFSPAEQKKKSRRHRYKKKSTARMVILGYILFLLLVMALCVLDAMYMI